MLMFQAICMISEALFFRCGEKYGRKKSGLPTVQTGILPCHNLLVFDVQDTDKQESSFFARNKCTHSYTSTAKMTFERSKTVFS